MKLSRMQDVGGCRAIMPGGSTEVAGVLRRMERRWQVLDVQNYVERPQTTGYRATHVVVMRDGRRIEVQLRTPHQHAWAVMVEGLGLRLRMPLKEDGGDPELLRYLALAARGLALEEAGRHADAELRAEFLEARRRVHRYLDRPNQDPPG